MVKWEQLCRICCNTGEYDFFSPIPAYLHGRHNDFLDWQTPINELVGEITGLVCTTDDCLPGRICAMCISYLKHASNFRNQTIKSALNLTAVLAIRKQDDNVNKELISNYINDDDFEEIDRIKGKQKNIFITEQDLSRIPEREIDSNLLVNQDYKNLSKNLINNKINLTQPSKQQIQEQMQYLNQILNEETDSKKQFKNGDRKNKNSEVKKVNRQNRHRYPKADLIQMETLQPDFSTAYFNIIEEKYNKKDKYTVEEEDDDDDDDEEEEEIMSTTSGDEANDECNFKKQNVFSYRELCFEEDDIMADIIEDYQNILSIPEDHKERKCRACMRRFLSDDTLDLHMSGCIQYQFLVFTEDINRLLMFRQNKATSPHEYFRRMIFCLRKMCDWLKSAHCSNIDVPNSNDDVNDNIANANKKSMGSVTQNESNVLMNSTKFSTDNWLRSDKPFRIDECTNSTKLDKERFQKLMNSQLCKKIIELVLNVQIGSKTTDSFNSNINNTVPLFSSNYNIPNNLSNKLNMFDIDQLGSGNYTHNLKHLPNNSYNTTPPIMPMTSTYTSSPLMKPIPVIATKPLFMESSSPMTKNTNTTSDIVFNNAIPISFRKDESRRVCERTLFMNKLKQATIIKNPNILSCSEPEDSINIIPLNTNNSLTPIRVRKDLLARQPPHVGFAGQCNQCKISFNTLQELELHNAINHNKA